MSKYNKTVLTNAGIELVRRVNAGKAKFSITKCATSSENLSDKSITELQELTELPSIMQYGEIADITDSAQDKDTVIGALLKFNNKGLRNGYNINTIGLYAKEEGSDKEFLYVVATAIDPERMPDFTDKAMFQFNVTVYVVVGQTSNVTVNVTEDGVATKKDLGGLKNEVDKKADKSDVKTQVSDAVTEAKKYTDDQAKTKVDVDTFNIALKAKANKDEVNSDLAGKLDKTEFTKFKTDNQKVLDTKLDKATYENDIKQVGKVKSASINGSEKISPDATGNLDLKVDIPVTSANGQTGDVQIPVFAPNLLTGTSDQLQTIGGNGLLSDTSVSIKTGEKYTLNAWIDNTKGNSGDDKVSIWYLDNTSKAITMSSGNAISDGRAGYSSVTVIFTSPNVTKITAHISGSAVPVKEAKLAKWQDINTPPDMTWLPHTADIKQYTDDKVDKLPKTFNKKASDTTGNIDITASDTGAYSKAQTDTELAKKTNNVDFDNLKSRVDKLPKSASVNGGKQVLPNDQGSLAMTVPMFAPNLLEGTSASFTTIAKNKTVKGWGYYQNFEVGSKYTISADVKWPDDATGEGDINIYFWFYDKDNKNLEGGGSYLSTGAVKPDQKFGTVTNTKIVPEGTVKMQVLSENFSPAYDVQVKNVKLAKWRDKDTPPDMLHLLNSKDIVKEANNYTDSKINNLSNTYQTKSAASSQYNSLSSDITAAKNRAVSAESSAKSYTDNRISGISIPNMNNYYTWSEVDNKIAAAVKTKAEQKDLDSVKSIANYANKATFDLDERITNAANKINDMSSKIQNMQYSIDSLNSQMSRLNP
ncbi:hypothetical protein OZX56_05185 [Lactobacillus sp. ESL0684]|uniref:hypothetical protein n=1 Tax=Lactobacillus sp. ESL0684 TaxID=2983213 RepID=UPI0023F96A78|nr:hypothetical protein [Lactobacillus sp. ESL0684]WEV42943.1 hypothetical protein OZX56_05185 [Lactobacillus sp. ESL0684]